MYGSYTSFASFGPQQDTWYTIQAMFTKSSYGDTLAIYINGAEATSLTINTSGENSVAGIRIGIPYNDAGYTSAVFADSVIIHNSYI